jgi:hypothetical protein
MSFAGLAELKVRACRCRSAAVCTHSFRRAHVEKLCNEILAEALLLPIYLAQGVEAVLNELSKSAIPDRSSTGSFGRPHDETMDLIYELEIAESREAVVHSEPLTISKMYELPSRNPDYGYR